MDGYRRLVRLTVAVGLLGICGAQCPNTLRRYTDPLPPALPPAPSLSQVIDVVNGNNSQIQSFSTTQARLSGPGHPTLRASVAFERPYRFRLRADTPVTGPELDVGSNDQVFWFWVKRSQTPAVYYCRHDRFATSRARQVIPIDPYLLIEALGTAGFDPALPHQGPEVLPGGRLKVTTIRELTDGPVTKVTIVDADRGWILEQHVFDVQNRHVASSIASGHRRDPLSGLVMPTAVKIDCPEAQFSIQVDLGNVQINRLSGNPDELWAMPSYQGGPWVDLSEPSNPPYSPAARAAAMPAGWLQPNRPAPYGYRLRY